MSFSRWLTLHGFIPLTSDAFHADNASSPSAYICLLQDPVAFLHERRSYYPGVACFPCYQRCNIYSSGLLVLVMERNDRTSSQCRLASAMMYVPIHEKQRARSVLKSPFYFELPFHLILILAHEQTATRKLTGTVPREGALMCVKRKSNSQSTPGTILGLLATTEMCTSHECLSFPSEPPYAQATQKPITLVIASPLAVPPNSRPGLVFSLLTTTTRPSSLEGSATFNLAARFHSQ